MTWNPQIEQKTLDVLADNWRSRGYDVELHPSPQKLPPALRALKPDAIATKNDESILFEVFSRPTAENQPRIKRIQSLIKLLKKWRLEVVYAIPSISEVSLVSPQTARKSIEEVENLEKISPAAALLYAWGILEAVTRSLEPSLLPRSALPSSVIDALISNGHRPQEDGRKLREIVQKRNAVAHGQLDLAVSADDVSYLKKVIDELMPEEV